MENVETKSTPQPPVENTPAKKTEDNDPVYVIYKGVKWKLKPDPPLTFMIKTLLETKPGLIALKDNELVEDYFAKKMLSAVIRDCLEYNCKELNSNRGDSPEWRSAALWCLMSYDRDTFEDLDPEARDPYFII